MITTVHAIRTPPKYKTTFVGTHGDANYNCLTSPTIHYPHYISIELQLQSNDTPTIVVYKAYNCGIHIYQHKYDSQ